MPTGSNKLPDEWIRRSACSRSGPATASGLNRSDRLGRAEDPNGESSAHRTGGRRGAGLSGTGSEDDHRGTGSPRRGDTAESRRGIAGARDRSDRKEEVENRKRDHIRDGVFRCRVLPGRIDEVERAVENVSIQIGIAGVKSQRILTQEFTEIGRVTAGAIVIERVFLNPIRVP